jgi:hypothetical protein
VRSFDPSGTKPPPGYEITISVRHPSGLENLASVYGSPSRVWIDSITFVCRQSLVAADIRAARIVTKLREREYEEVVVANSQLVR